MAGGLPVAASKGDTMIRKLLCALALGAAMAASACTYGSAVDMAPMNARPLRPVLPPGDYCEVQGTSAPFFVISASDCVPLVWDRASRTYTMLDPDDPEDATTAAVVSLGAGLYLGQIEVETETPDKYQLLLFLAKGEAFATLPSLGDDRLREVAARHGKLSFANDRAGRPYIAAGRRGDIKAFLMDAARRSLQEIEEEDDELSIGVRDSAGAANHTATREQARDIAAVLKAAEALTPK